jgi:hypothetical protein
MYFFLLVTWLAIILIAPPGLRHSLAALSILVAIIGALYFRMSTRRHARRLLGRAAEGDERARRLYLARTRSRFGDVAREYLEELLAASSSDDRVLPLLVRQLGHPDPLAREMTEDRLARIGSQAAAPLVHAVLGKELSGDGAFRARRLLYRWRSELPQDLAALLESFGYWQDG